MFIMNHEGIRQTAYLDAVDVPTICAGHTKKVKLGQTATLDQCQQFIKEDTGEAGKAIARCTTALITQDQYDMLVDFAFNVGGEAYCNSTLVRKLNSGNCVGAANEFSRWNKAGGRVLKGLTKRRADERIKFISDC